MEPKDVCKTRRDAAKSLRESVKRDDWLDVAVARAVKESCGIKAKAFGGALADLIDQPTCTMEKTDSYKTESGETVNVWECSRCGETCEEINGRYEFCPHFGAEVVEDEG